MSLFSKLLGVFKKKRHTALEVPSGSFTFLGKPHGEVEVLENTLIPVLKGDSGLKRAYLTLIQYAGDQTVRMALCLDTDSSPEKTIRSLSEFCAERISSIDIMFFSDLNQCQIDQLKSVSNPFFEAGEAWWHQLPNPQGACAFEPNEPMFKDSSLE